MKPTCQTYVLSWHSRPLTLLKFNREGDMLFSCGKDGVISCGYAHNGERLGTYDGHNGAVFAIDITFDCRFLVSVSADSTMRFWRVETGEEIWKEQHGGICKFVEWCQHPTNQISLASCSDRFGSGESQSPNKIVIWEFEYDQYPEEPLTRRLQIDDDLPMKCAKIGWGPFDQSIVSIHDEGTAFVWCAKTGRELKVLKAHNAPLTGLQFTADRTVMITCSKDQTVKLWQTKDWKEIRKHKGDRPINDAALSPMYDSKDPTKRKYHLLFGGGQEARDVTTTAGAEGKFEAVFFNIVFEEEVGCIKGHFSPINTVAWLPDGSGFATGAEEGNIRVHHFDQEYWTRKYE